MTWTDEETEEWVAMHAASIVQVCTRQWCSGSSAAVEVPSFGVAMHLGRLVERVRLLMPGCAVSLDGRSVRVEKVDPKPRTIEAAVSVLRVQPGDVVCVFVQPGLVVPPEQLFDMNEHLRRRFSMASDVVLFQGCEKLTVLRDGKQVEPTPEPSVVVEVLAK